MVFGMSAYEVLTVPVVVAASPRWDLRMGNQCTKDLSTGFTVQPGWVGEGGTTDSQQRGPRITIHKSKVEEEEVSQDKGLLDFRFQKARKPCRKIY